MNNTRQITLTEGDSAAPPPELQNLTAADRVDVLKFGIVKP